jgi:Protein of unknown function (DUF1579)
VTAEVAMGRTVRKTSFAFVAFAVVLFGVHAQETAPTRKPSQEMTELAGMVGSWAVTLESRNTPDEPFVKLQTTSVITSMLAGKFNQEKLILPTPSGRNVEMIGIWAYDKYRSVYRFAWLDDMFGLFDVMEGNRKDGVLIVDNLRTRTSFMAGGQEYLSRMKWGPIGPDGFDVESQVSTDGGATWFAQTRGRYSRSD